MSAKEHLKTLLAEPSNREARRFLSGIASQRVATELQKLDLDERPNLSAIASEILEEHGAELTPAMREELLPVIRSVVDGVFDDDEASGVTELFKEWQATGRVDGEHLFEVLQVPLGKRLRWVLGKQKFGSLKRKISPGDLLSELYLRLSKYGIPTSLENRKEFFWYSEKVLKNLLIDMQRADGRLKRAVGDERPLDDLIKILHESGEIGGTLSLSPEIWLDLGEAVDKLPERLRAAVRYRYLWEWEMKDVQAALGVSRATVNRLLSEGLVSLRERMGIGGYGPPVKKP